MKDNKKGIPDFNDLVFENRNREYGAYLLRKSYNTIVIVSLIIASVIMSSAVVIPYLHILGKKFDNGQDLKIRYVQIQMEKIEPPKEEIIIPPEAPPPPAIQINIKYIAPVVVDSVLPFEKPQPTVADIQALQSANDQLIIVGTGNYDQSITGEEGEFSDEPFFIVEVTPTFKGGGVEKFREWIQKRTNYPQIAHDNGIKGKVYLTFVIERDGSVSNVKVVKGVAKILDDEAVKVIEASPKWSPGLQRGRPVRVRYAISLDFTL